MPHYIVNPRGKTSATSTGDLGIVYNVRPRPNFYQDGTRSLQRPPPASITPISRSSSASRSRNNYASPTMASRMQSRSLSRSHEERSPRTGRKVEVKKKAVVLVEAARPVTASTASQPHLTHSFPSGSRNALYQPITAQARKKKKKVNSKARVAMMSFFCIERP